jgi:Carboxypeptidase regulatory-like domain
MADGCDVAPSWSDERFEQRDRMQVSDAMTVHRRLGTMGVIAALLPMIGCHRSAVASGGDCIPFPGLGPPGIAVTLPVVADGANDEVLLVGSVADSLTGRILKGAVVRLLRIDAQPPDSSFALSTDSGQFTVRGIRPGRYRYRVLTVNFHPAQGTIDLRPGRDTLQVTMKPSPVQICSVRLTRLDEELTPPIGSGPATSPTAAPRGTAVGARPERR